ncbi:MAG: ABC transporter ATP-binding protein [Deltaproteobacteria bacterium]|nr:ABC transporter ATP-binding protein [Deltaproteobacteria bacterium]
MALDPINPIIKVENVVKTYGSNSVTTAALQGVSLSLCSGDFTVMAGPSGSGKSTLLNIIGGLDRPTSGRVEIEGRDLSAMKDSDVSLLRRDRIGFIFQGYNLIPVMTAMENAEYVMMLKGVPVAQRRERVREVLDQVGLSGLENRFPRELSGGQQQRVAIARAIAAEPALVLADEPTANVDSKTGEALITLMRSLNEKGVTFLFSTHDHAIMRQARQMIVLKDGRIESES